MIAYLKGRIIHSATAPKNIAHCVIEVNGVGYRVTISQKDLPQLREQTELYTHQHIWDGGQELYGFLNRGDLDFFLLLININGIGPKSALNILSHASAEDIRNAVISGDGETFSKTSGLGKKTAEKIILGLKDHLSQMIHDSGGEIAVGGQLEVVEALMSLGFPREHVQRVLSQLPTEAQTSEDKIKAALKLLGKKK